MNERRGTRRRRPPHWSRRALDEWFPTIVRYAGFCLMLYAVFVDRGRNPALIPAATGMIFLKNVIGDHRGD